MHPEKGDGGGGGDTVKGSVYPWHLRLGVRTKMKDD